MDKKHPKMKSVFPWYKVDSTVVIEAQDGFAHKIEDSQGHAEYILSIMDGNRTVDEIVDDFRGKFSEVPKEDILLTISSFDDMGLLESKTSPPESFDEYKKNRFSRNLGFFELYSSLNKSKYDFQERLCNAHIAMLGVGGVGSHVALSLVGLGVGRVTIVDYDEVDLSNLNRQILYKESDIGTPKITAAAKRMKEFGTRTEVTTVNLKLSSPQDVASVVKGCDLALVAVDRPKTTIMSWVNEGCVSEGVPYVTGGVDRDRALHYTVIPGITGCVECWQRSVKQADPDYNKILELMVAQEETGVRFGEDFAGIYPLVAVQAAALTAELVRIITKVDKPLAAGRVMSIPFKDFSIRETETWSRDMDCPVCGHLPNSNNAKNKILSVN